MEKTVLIEQTAKNIKRTEAIALAVLFGSIAAGLGVTMFIIAGIAFVGFMAVRIRRWWLHG